MRVETAWPRSPNRVGGGVHKGRSVSHVKSFRPELHVEANLLAIACKLAAE